MLLLPVDLTLDNYKEVFKNDNIMRGYRNSLAIMFLGTALNLVMTILAAFPMSRKDLWGRGVMMKLMTFCMFFGGGLIPTYLIYKNIGILDTRFVIIFSGMMSLEIICSYVISGKFSTLTLALRLIPLGSGFPSASSQSG